MNAPIQDKEFRGTFTPQSCEYCSNGFPQNSEIVTINGGMWHPKCFLCAQCFQPLEANKFYQFGDRFFCEHDFQKLYCPMCQGCGDCVSGRVIKAFSQSWHPDCFRCCRCVKPLEGDKFTQFLGRPYCQPCRDEERNALGDYVPCHKCKTLVGVNEKIKYLGEFYHAYHFKCRRCNAELTPETREVQGQLYCIRCFDSMGISICAACHRPVEARVVWALGKAWHSEHFVCKKCEKPFLGSVYFEQNNSAYCEQHFAEARGFTCFVCSQLVVGDYVNFGNKIYCLPHFFCFGCDKQVKKEKDKIIEIDLKPYCLACYRKLPAKLRKRLEELREVQNQ